MVKTIFFLLFFIYGMSVLHAQTDIIRAENLSTLGLSGKVKSLTEISYNAKKGSTGIAKTTKGWQYDFENDSESFFDTLGNLVLEHKVLPAKKEEVYTIKYDSLKRIIEVNRSQFTQRFVYDSLNRVISSQKENRSTEVFKSTAVTNYLYYYNAQGLLIKTEEFGEQAGVCIETFQYGPSKNLIFSELKAGEFTETHQYKYNEDLMLIKEEWKDSKAGMLETNSYTYKDKQKFLDHWVEYDNGAPDGSIDDTYEKGNVIKSVEKDADGVIVVLETCSYQFDSHGNWIQKTITNDGKYYIVERVITYY